MRVRGGEGGGGYGIERCLGLETEVYISIWVKIMSIDRYLCTLTMGFPQPLRDHDVFML